MTEIRTRIAPSPTGNLHLGTVRTALYNLLLAKKHGGKFLFRLEDTDQKRSKEEFTQEIVDGFKWLGISWDSLDADFLGNDDQGMVRQSQRLGIHDKYIQKLLDEKKAYKCYATPEELDEMKKQQRANKQAEGYDNRGRDLSDEEIKAYIDEGRKAVVRLNLGNGEITWDDVVRGPMSINVKDLGGDPVIQKANGQVLYNFAVVIDDFEMGLTHVFRGEDHLTNTAKQIACYKNLDMTVPVFGHLPLIFTKDKQKLSKRKHGDIAGVEKYKREGYLAEALVNYLIATSYTRADEAASELYSLDEEAAIFNESGISKSPAIYDIQKLNWYNREYIAKLSYDELYDYLKPYISFDMSKFTNEEQKLIIEAIRGNLNKFDEIDSNISYFFKAEEIEAKLVKFIDEGRVVLKDLLTAVEEDKLDFNSAEMMKNFINELGESKGLKAKKLFWPIRIAISSRTSGPDLGLIMHLLGKVEVQKRLSESLSLKI